MEEDGEPITLTNVELAPSIETDKRLQQNDYSPNVDIENKITLEDTNAGLLYNVSDNPPIHLTVLFAFQQALLSLSSSLAISFLIADVVCAKDNEDIKTTLLSSTLLMNGITTLFMITLGIRLPLFQGPASDYIVPLLVMASLNPDRCTLSLKGVQLTVYLPFNNCSIVTHYSQHCNKLYLNMIQILNKAVGSDEYFNIEFEIDGNLTTFDNSTSNETLIQRASMDLILSNIQAMQGSLIAAGAVHFLIGVTGLVGFLLRFIGPVTIVPTILLTGLYITRATTDFAKVHWGVSATTAMLAIILSLYLTNYKTPIPIWTPTKGFHVIRYPLHQVFSILIAMLLGWAMSAIMTACEVFSDDPKSSDYLARTDARTDVIDRAHWFYVPYPGQFGPISFSVPIFVAFIIATITSIFDSVGDYYACAKMCHVPPPPSHGVNRGTAVEGFCSVISGCVGCGHATTTYGGNIGAIGVTRVASRSVFFGVAIIYILFGVIGKFSAIFITIPYPVLGGALIVMYGMFNGVVLSNLQVISLNSVRNLAIIGTALLVGLMVPYYVENNKEDISTGDPEKDNIIKMLLANPNLAGGIFACFLDNTIPGTKDERGINAWQKISDDVSSNGQYAEGNTVYEPLLPAKFKSARIMEYIPFLIYKPRNQDKQQVKDVILLKKTKIEGVV